MVTKINILYISLTGNTTVFINKLSQEYKQQGIDVVSLNVKEHRDFKVLNEPFVTFLPAFLEGGNGIDTGDTEILTTILKDYLEFEDNYKLCYGIVGSGNRNFNKQFALSAQQYSEHFGFPLLDTYELRGTPSDVKRISQAILASLNTLEEVI